MGLTVWIVIGAIAGFIACEATRSRGGIMLISLGIIGSLVLGSTMAAGYGVGSPDHVNTDGALVALVGATVVLSIAVLLRHNNVVLFKRRHSRHS